MHIQFSITWIEFGDFRVVLKCHKNELILLKWYFHIVTATDEYIDSGFLALQLSLDKTYIELTTDKGDEIVEVFESHQLSW